MNVSRPFLYADNHPAQRLDWIPRAHEGETMDHVQRITEILYESGLVSGDTPAEDYERAEFITRALLADKVLVPEPLNTYTDDQGNTAVAVAGATFYRTGDSIVYVRDGETRGLEFSLTEAEQFASIFLTLARMPDRGEAQ